MPKNALLPERHTIRLDRANVVGVVESPAGLRAARRLAGGILDAVELRLDRLGEVPAVLRGKGLPVPVIATVRHSSEGGARGIAPRKRRALYEAALACADVADVELARAEKDADIIGAARAEGRAIILSHHDFQKSVPLAEALELARAARDLGADVFKLAVTPARPEDLGDLLSLVARAPLPVAAMAMGKYGKISRLLLGACGSVLNYGWIERPVVAGQWSAPELGARLAELRGPGTRRL